MSIFIVDIIIIAVLILFGWLGAKKGLILSLFSLLSLFVAFYGARYVTTSFTQPVADILRPSIQLSVNEILVGVTPETTFSPSDAEGVDGSDETSVSTDYSLTQILRQLDKNDRFPGLQEYLEEAIEEDTIEITTSASAAVAAFLARLAASAILFGLSFVLILLLWFLVSRALDLAFKLPVLSAVNALGGLLLGIIKGGVVLLVLVWLGKLAGWITPDNAGPITNMMTLEQISAALRELIATAAAAVN